MTQQSYEALSALLVGFAFSGLLASGFRAATGGRLGVALLHRGGMRALACVPILVFSAPALIIARVAGSDRSERWPVPGVMLATMIACGWSLLSGRVALDLAHLVAGV